MNEENYEWLSHLKGSIPDEAYGDRIDMYVMALEGWKRGLDLTFINIQSKNRVRYELSNKNREHTFSVTRGDKVSNEAVSICIRKHLTKKYLEKSGIPVPKGDNFTEESTDEDIIKYSHKIGFPVVIKPTNGSRGKGVISNIQTPEELVESLQYLRRDLNYPDIIIEQYFPGEEFRLHVVDNNVVGIIKRIPANIVGDGIHTIEELIALKNKRRKKVPNLYARLIQIDKEVLNHIKDAGYNKNSILEKEEQLFLRKKSNLSAGGDSIDYTEVLTEEIKQIAIGASNAIPGLGQCGVDIIVNEKENTGVVIEVNSRAGVGAHLFPLKGKARDIPKAIIDYYFPETISKSDSTEKSKVYFDFKSVLDILKSGKAEEVKVQRKPKNIVVKKYILSGKDIDKKDEKWIYRKATGLKLNGFLENNPHGGSFIVIGGNTKRVGKFKSMLDGATRFKGLNIEEKKWNKPIQIGFSVNEKGTEDIKKNVTEIENLRIDLQEEKQNVKQYKENIEKVAKQLNKSEQAYNDILNSKTWRYTSPMRKISKFIKMRD